MKNLPTVPRLEKLRNDAKDLLAALRRQEPAALKRAAETINKQPGERFVLAEAQWIIAREYGFASWPKLKEHIDRVTLQGMAPEEREGRFLRHLLDGRRDLAERVLACDPALPRRSLHIAAGLGEVDEVKGRLGSEPGAAKATAEPHGVTPLYCAAVSRFHLDSQERAEEIRLCAQLLLKEGADVNASFHTGDPDYPLRPLYAALGPGYHPELAKLLIDAGAEVNDNESFYHAAEQPDNRGLRLMINAGAEWRETNVLARKLDFEDLEGVKMLLEYGVDPEAYSPSALHHAILRGRSPEMVQLLLDYDARLDSKDDAGRDPINKAAFLGRVELFDLLSRHVDLETVDQGNLQIVHVAAGNRYELGPEAGEAVTMAAWEGRADDLRRLLDAGAPVGSRRGSDNGTALHCACFPGHAECAELLLSRGADVNDKDNSFEATPLEWTMHGSANANLPTGDFPATVRTLLNHGAPVPERAEGSPEVRTVLVEHGAVDEP
jgi:ankyrin repeat protein